MKKIFLLSCIGFIVFSANAQITQRSYGNDVALNTQGSYSVFYQDKGIAIYSAWVTNNNGNATQLCIKVVNNNNYRVLITWSGIKWYANGSYMDPQSNPGMGGDFYPYSDKYNPGETKEGIYHHAGGPKAAEVYQFRPNYLYFNVPKGNWIQTKLSFRLPDIDVLQKF